MTDNEIIKALMYCSGENFEDDCPKCPLRDDGNCNCNLAKYSLDFINRQKAEIERLQKHLGETHYKLEYLLCEATGGLLSKHTYNADTMITYAHNYALKCSDEAQAEAVKEFAERLCEGKLSNDPVVIAVKCELKEMAGDTDAET